MKKLFVLLILLIVFINLFGKNMVDDKKKFADSAEEICPIKVGEQVPEVFVKSPDGDQVNLKEYISGRNTVLIFYRGGWCPFCNLQLSNLNKIDNELVEIGYKLVAISIDKPEKLKESLENHNLNYTLLSDSKADASIAFGLAFKVEDKYNKMLKSHNMDIEEASGENHHILPVPAVYLVDSNGVIQFDYVNPNYKARIDEQLLLKAARHIAN